MTDIYLVTLDLVAIAVLVFGLYFPRHHRRDMVVAYLVVNVGVLGVSEALLASTVSAGLGLGLFGVLSIIRLRSEELAQHEVAYYFAALALGLLGGLAANAGLLTGVVMALIVLALYVGDHPQLFPSFRNQTVTLDRAYLNEAAARARLEELLDARVHQLTIRKVDLVRDTTVVDVRYRIPERAGRRGDGSATAVADSTSR
jgi:hypothetical protein